LVVHRTIDRNLIGLVISGTDGLSVGNWDWGGGQHEWNAVKKSALTAIR
jgi:hypothetical protein